MWIISLIWPKRGCDAEQGMVLGVRGLKRVEEQARVLHACLRLVPTFFPWRNLIIDHFDFQNIFNTLYEMNEGHEKWPRVVNRVAKCTDFVLRVSVFEGLSAGHWYPTEQNIIHFVFITNFCRMILLIVDLQNLLPFEGSGEDDEGSAGGGTPDIVDHPQNEGLSRENR